jgi:pyridine nucleotide-disulfide oxidoreductase
VRIYLTEVLPALLVLGLGLVATVAPLTSTVLAAAPSHQAGVASAVNNDVARTASLLPVAILPAAAGLTGVSYLFDTEEMMSGRDGQLRIVIAGAGYAGLHAAQRSGRWLERHDEVEMTLVDRNDYHQLTTELPRVATGTREVSGVEVDLDKVLSDRVRFVRATITGFDVAERGLVTDAGHLPYDYLVLALGSRPNDFGIPGPLPGPFLEHHWSDFESRSG